MARLNIEDRWDFYPARINDNPASVFLNLDFANHAPIAGCTYVGCLFITMPDPGDHGMGGDEIYDRMQGIEDDITGAIAAEAQGYFVARIRGEGMWQLYFYTPSQAAFESNAGVAMAPYTDLEFDTGGKDDADWSVYRDFLWPSPERMQWMSDRSVVDLLESHGDPLTVPRVVSHWVYFPSTEARASFESVVASRGFNAIDHQERTDRDPPNPYGIQIDREDPVDLESIHAVVMELVEAANDAGGDYDGWETFIVKPTAE